MILNVIMYTLMYPNCSNNKGYQIMAREELEEFAHQAIIRMILDHRFKPGDFLLETQLADILRLSHTPVRQALGRLVAEGFLEKKKKRGCYIPLPDAEDA